VSLLRSPVIRSVLGDPCRLLQVPDKLLGNALKLTPGPGTIVVGLEDAGELVKFSVTDTGGCSAPRRRGVET
jgi:signal transduction histidine kinase